jgi:hypothetical protein
MSRRDMALKDSLRADAVAVAMGGRASQVDRSIDTRLSQKDMAIRDMSGLKVLTCLEQAWR